MKKHLCFTFLLIVFASGLCLGQTDSGNNPPSLGDLARQQHHGKKAERVFTDADLPARSSAGTEDRDARPQGSGAAQAGAAASAATPSAKVDNSDKAAKPDTAAKKQDGGAELKQKLDHYTTERDAWKQAAKRYEDLLANEKDEFRRQSYEDAISKDRHNAELYQSKIEEIQASQSKPPQGQSSDASAGSSGHQ